MFDIDEAAYNPEIMPILVDNVLPLEDSKPVRIDHCWSKKKGFQPFASCMLSLCAPPCFC